MPTIKTCGRCRTTYADEAAFRELALCGYGGRYQAETGEWRVLELRNCACGSTLAIEVPFGPETPLGRAAPPRCGSAMLTRAQLARGVDPAAVSAALERLAELISALWGTVPGRDPTAIVEQVEQFLAEWSPQAPKGEDDAAPRR